ncbi:GtrA family protein [Blastococcus sp. SYSU DS0617]
MPSPRGRSALIGKRARRRLKELSAFGIVGGIAFVVDIGLFQLLYGHLDVGAVTSKTLATLVSMCVAFLGHRNWAFAHRDKTTIRRSFALFALINAGTLVLGAAIIWFVRYPLDQESLLIIQAANIASIGLNSVLRYLAYRRWVFPAVIPPAAVAVTDPRPDTSLAGDPPPPASADGGGAVPAVTRGSV